MTAIPAPTNRVPFFALLTSYGSVHLSVILAMVAIPWFVLETTGSAARTGIIGAVQGVPMIIAGIFGGVIVDRLGFRRTAILSDIFSSLSFGMIPILHFTTGISFTQLVIFVFLGSAFDTPGFTARLSMLPDIATRTGLRLERANSTTQMISQSAMLFAPALAGILIGIIGAGAVIFVTMTFFMVSAIAVTLFIPKPEPMTAAERSIHTRGRYFDALKQGLNFVFVKKLIMAMLIVMMMIQFVRACLMVILPVYAFDTYGSSTEFGFMFAALGAGGLISALTFGIYGHRLPRRPIVLVGIFAMSIGFGVLALNPGYFAILGGLFLMGVLTGAVTPLCFTIMQENTPAELRGRVFGLYDAAIFGAMVPGRLMAGYLMEWTGVITSVVFMGGGYLLAVGLALTNRSLRTVSHPPEPFVQPEDQAADSDRQQVRASIPPDPRHEAGS